MFFLIMVINFGGFSTVVENVECKHFWIKPGIVLAEMYAHLQWLNRKHFCAWLLL